MAKVLVVPDARLDIERIEHGIELAKNVSCRFNCADGELL